MCVQLISQLLLEMDGCPGGVVILAATNHPEAIDNSILRPGKEGHRRLHQCVRFSSSLSLSFSDHDRLFVFTIGRLDRLVYVPPPTLEERIAILRILKNSTRFSDTTDLYTVGNLTSNFTGADMKALVRKAGLYALKDNRVGVHLFVMTFVLVRLMSR